MFKKINIFNRERNTLSAETFNSRLNFFARLNFNGFFILPKIQVYVRLTLDNVFFS